MAWDDMVADVEAFAKQVRELRETVDRVLVNDGEESSEDVQIPEYDVSIYYRMDGDHFQESIEVEIEPIRDFGGRLSGDQVVTLNTVAEHNGLNGEIGPNGAFLVEIGKWESENEV